MLNRNPCPLTVLCSSLLLLLLAQTARARQGLSAEDSSSKPLIERLDVFYLAKSRGFRLESHRIVTEDQYILNVHRLVNPLAGQLKGLVILQHGILCASPFFLMNSSPNLDRPSRENATTSNSIAIALANSGHDVWLTNFRGTNYSRGHLSSRHNYDNNRYWDFNVDTLIEQDLKAYVNYILLYTNKPNYTFIGHSLGATVGLGSLLVHQNTSITKRLSCSILMAPVASTKYMKGSLLTLFRMASLIYNDPAPFPGATATFSAYIRQICFLMPRICTWLASMVIGAKQGDIRNIELSAPNEMEFQNQVNSFVLMMHQSVSIQMLKHIIQVHLSGRLSRFNYGSELNRALYGRKLAPIYDLTQIHEPKLSLAIINGPSDAISTPGEVSWISEQVSDRVGHFERITTEADPFNHMDLVLSKDAGRLVNSKIVEFIERNKC